LSLARSENPATLEARIHRFWRTRLSPYKVPLHIGVTDDGQRGRCFKKIRPDAANEHRWTAQSS
jgi:hypothetical protein